MSRRRKLAAAAAVVVAAVGVGTIATDSCACDAPAPDYYVATTGSNTNPGTAGSPFLTLDKAYDTASGGDVVSVAAGDYGDQTITGSKAGTDDVIFRANGTVRVAEDSGEGFDVNGPDSLTFDGFYIRDLDVTATDITFRNFTHNSGTFSGSKQISFINGTFTKPSAISGRDDAAFFGGSEADNVDVLFDNVTFNEVIRPASNPTGHTDCIQFTGVNGATIRNSRFIRCDDASIIAKADQGTLLNMTVENNWFGKGVCDGGVELDGGACDPANIEIGLAGNNADDSCSGVIRFNSINEKQRSMNCVPPNAGDLSFYGNIVREMTNTACSDTHANVTLDRNLFIIDDVSASPCGTNTTVADPLWVNNSQDTTAMNLHLGAGSPAIDAATGVSCVGADIDRDIRPRGAACDLGSDER